jgi:hypothetical protein
MIMNELDKKRQAIIDDMLEDCNNDPRFLKNLIEDYVWTFKEEVVEMLYDGLNEGRD